MIVLPNKILWILLEGELAFLERKDRTARLIYQSKVMVQQCGPAATCGLESDQNVKSSEQYMFISDHS